MNYVIFKETFNKDEKYQNVFDIIDEINGVKIDTLLEQEHDVEMEENDYYKILHKQIRNGIYFVKNNKGNIIGEIDLMFAENSIYHNDKYDCDFCIEGKVEIDKALDFWKEYYDLKETKMSSQCTNCEKGNIEYYYDSYEGGSYVDLYDLEWKPLVRTTKYEEYFDYEVFNIHKIMLEGGE